MVLPAILIAAGATFARDGALQGWSAPKVSPPTTPHHHERDRDRDKPEDDEHEYARLHNRARYYSKTNSTAVRTRSTPLEPRRQQLAEQRLQPCSEMDWPGKTKARCGAKLAMCNSYREQPRQPRAAGTASGTSRRENLERQYDDPCPSSDDGRSLQEACNTAEPTR